MMLAKVEVCSIVVEIMILVVTMVKMVVVVVELEMMKEVSSGGGDRAVG